MNRYTVFYGSRNTTLFAKTSFEACEKGIAYFKVPAKRAYLVSAHLTEKAGQEIAQPTAL